MTFGSQAFDLKVLPFADSLNRKLCKSSVFIRAFQPFADSVRLTVKVDEDIIKFSVGIGKSHIIKEGIVTVRDNAVRSRFELFGISGTESSFFIIGKIRKSSRCHSVKLRTSMYHRDSKPFKYRCLACTGQAIKCNTHLLSLPLRLKTGVFLLLLYTYQETFINLQPL